MNRAFNKIRAVSVWLCIGFFAAFLNVPKGFAAMSPLSNGMVTGGTAHVVAMKSDGKAFKHPLSPRITLTLAPATTAYLTATGRTTETTSNKQTKNECKHQ